MLKTLVIATSATLITLAAPLVASGQELTEAEKARIAEEVTAAVEQYYQYYADRNMAALPGGVFNIPWIQVGNGINADMTMEEAQAGFDAALAGLLERGWDKSVYTTTHVCVVNANFAITSGYNTRWHSDGHMMSVGGVAYSFARADDGWKIISYTSQPRDQVIRCD